MHNRRSEFLFITKKLGHSIVRERRKGNCDFTSFFFFRQVSPLKSRNSNTIDYFEIALDERADFFVGREETWHGNLLSFFHITMLFEDVEKRISGYEIM